MDQCKLCVHYHGGYPEPTWDSRNCVNCIHYHTHKNLVDNFKINFNGLSEAEVYEYLKKKFEK